MGIQIKSFRKFEKNTLKGFCDVLLMPSGLEIRDLTVHEGHGKRWVNMPSRPYQDENGETKYSYILFFPDKQRSEQFQQSVLKALKEYQPPQPARQGYSDDPDIPF
jgi:hypothetical protein